MLLTALLSQLATQDPTVLATALEVPEEAEERTDHEGDSLDPDDDKEGF